MNAVIKTNEVKTNQAVPAFSRYLHSLQWDGVDRIRYLFSTYGGTAFDTYHQRVAAQFMMSVVARAYVPGCAVGRALVLAGPQGCGKSLFLQALFSGACKEVEVNEISDVVFDQGLACVVFEEAFAVSKGEAQKLKAMVSSSAITVRKPYGRGSTSINAHFVYVFVTNDLSVLEDVSVSRRLMPVRLVLARADELGLARDQLWAEAVARYTAGEFDPSF